MKYRSDKHRRKVHAVVKSKRSVTFGLGEPSPIHLKFTFEKAKYRINPDIKKKLPNLDDE